MFTLQELYKTWYPSNSRITGIGAVDKMSERVLRQRDVQAKVGIGKTGLWAKVKDGSFPRPISLGKRAVGWLDSEVDQWISDRKKQRDKDA